jgi:tRNA-2-methylthio-N6-dimethylallyladenosine synthase
LAAAADGAVEVCLLGQNVNSYCGETGLSFAELLREVCRIDGIERVRFMTSHPKDLSNELIDVMSQERKICKHLHLPMQSGSSKVLARMNRKYSKESYLDLVRRIRAKIPQIALTTDIIIGFPGETEEDFEDTLDVVRQAGFAGAFTFIYSKRNGTPAADMSNQVPQHAAKERFNRLLATVNPIIYNESKKHAGKTITVLTDEQRAPNMYKGRSDDNSLVHFFCTRDCVGEFVDVQITEAKTFYLIGREKQEI